MKKAKLKSVTEAFPGASTASIEEWDAYLSGYEVPRREVLLNSDHYNRLAERETIKSIYENLEYQESHSDIAEEIRRALDTLTEKSRTVILMLYWQNMRKSEVAKKLGVSWETVYKTEKRSLLALKNELSEKNQENLMFTLENGIAG